MKHMKKLVTLLLALIMALALVVPAAAATVKNDTTHTYDAYQIFTGTQNSDSSALGDVKWGTGIDGTNFMAALKADTRFVVNSTNIFAACTDAAAVAAVLAENNTDAVAKAFANVAAQHLTSTVAASIAADAKDVDLPVGYYLLVDTSEPAVGDARNSALLQVTNKGDITIEKKYDVPTVDKSVQDNTSDAWEEAADWCIGSDVPFQLVGTLPSNYDDYEAYKYVFHDTLGDTLMYNNNVKVFVVNKDKRTEITVDFTANISGTVSTGGGGKLTVTCADLKQVANVTSESTIVVEYTAKLLDTAVIGQPGNPNKVYLEYANDPNFSGAGTPPTGNTPTDEVLVFTYELDITKVDGANQEKLLANAEFQLKNAENKWVIVDANNKVTGWADEQKDGSTLTTDAKGLAKIIGLDAGTYKLYETKAPGGYNQLKDPITIVISAELDKSENNPALTALTIKVDSGEAQNGNVTTGTVSTTVKNNSGATLPETGGIGTTLFYVIGGVLVVGAAVLLVTRKRMDNAK